MKHVEKLLTADLSEDPTKRLRHEVLWRDFIQKVGYISRNPKYKEILLEVGDVTEGGAPSDSRLQRT